MCLPKQARWRRETGFAAGRFLLVPYPLSLSGRKNSELAFILGRALVSLRTWQRRGFANAQTGGHARRVGRRLHSLAALNRKPLSCTFPFRTFLVRTSEHLPGCFILSLLHGHVYHFPIIRVCDAAFRSTNVNTEASLCSSKAVRVRRLTCRWTVEGRGFEICSSWSNSTN